MSTRKIDNDESIAIPEEGSSNNERTPDVLKDRNDAEHVGEQEMDNAITEQQIQDDFDEIGKDINI